jgi:hypothetical protein
VYGAIIAMGGAGICVGSIFAYKVFQKLSMNNKFFLIVFIIIFLFISNEWLNISYAIEKNPSFPE